MKRTAFILFLLAGSIFSFGQDLKFDGQYSPNWKSYERYEGDIKEFEKDGITYYSFDWCLVSLLSNSKIHDKYSFIFEQGLVSAQMLNRYLEPYYFSGTNKCKCDTSMLFERITIPTKLYYSDTTSNDVKIIYIKRLNQPSEKNIQLDLCVEISNGNPSHYFLELRKAGNGYKVEYFGSWYDEL